MRFRDFFSSLFSEAAYCEDGFYVFDVAFVFVLILSGYVCLCDLKTLVLSTDKSALWITHFVNNV